MSVNENETREKVKRIFMVGYSGNKGGVETYIDQLVKALPKYEIVLSLPVMTIAGREWLRPRNRHHYIRYRAFWHRFFRENHFDAVYYNTCDIVSLDMLRFAKHAGIPVRIIHSHNTGNQQDIEKKRSLFHQLSERINQRNLDCFATHQLACSEKAGRWMFGKRPFTVIRNGIDIERFGFREENREAVRKQYGFGEGLLVGIIGRLSAQKNPGYALHVLEALFRMEPSARAFFAGDGPLLEEIKDKAKRAGTGERIVFTGAVDDVPAWMSAADVLLMPSLFEGFPFVLIEAQASGLPCIVSSNVTREADLTGLVRFADLNESPEEWAKKLIECAGQKRKEYTAQIVSAGYTVQHMSEQVQKMFEGGDTTRG